MNTQTIINYWSYPNYEYNNKLQKMIDYFSKTVESDLVNLNLLDEIDKFSLSKINNKYWFICRKTGNVYLFNFDGFDGQNINSDIISGLSEINRYTFKQVNFELVMNKKRKLNDDFVIKNITIEDKSVLNLNKPSRNNRLKRREIIKSNSDTFKKRKLSGVDPLSSYISASSLRNFLLKDPLLDFLKEYNIYSLDDEPSKVPNSYSNVKPKFDTFTQHIMDAGKEFEDELIKILQKDHTIIKVAEYFHSKKPEKFEETIELMKKGTPIIYQAVLHNHTNQTMGMPDLLVRSDYLNKLLGYEVINEEEAFTPSPLLNTKYHYKVIDIKHSNIPLRADGEHILNSESIPAYKGQLCVYTMALNQILGIKINKAYIWGKKYVYEKCGIKYEITNFLNKLGTIDFDTVDYDYIEQTNNAIQWIKTLRSEGNTWTLLPIPCRSELFPNMKNEKDGEWRPIKNELNDKIGEITRVWNCGVSRRQNAHQNQVYTWRDSKCTSKILGFNPCKKAHTIDAILEINRQTKDLIRPSHISYERAQWKNNLPDTFEFYFDFETLNSNFGSIIKDGQIKYNNNQYIFMIGVGYYLNNQWQFNNFILDNKSKQSEIKMFTQFNDFIQDMLKKHNKKFAKFYHWSCAEVITWNNFKNRNPEVKLNDSNYIFYDLNKVFINEPISVHGALDYSLKSIAKALNKNKLIDSCWDSSSPCSNGLSAMILANQLYENKKSSVDTLLKGEILNDPIMKEIIYYNEIDCKVLYEIHNLMRDKF